MLSPSDDVQVPEEWSVKKAKRLKNAINQDSVNEIIYSKGGEKRKTVLGRFKTPKVKEGRLKTR